MSLAQKCIAESIGAFMIVFADCGAISVNQVSAGTIGHAGVATSFGPALIAGDLTNLWAYIIAPIAGALAGAWTYQYLRRTELNKPKADE